MVVEKEFELNDDCPFRVKIPNIEGHGSILHLQQCSMWYIELEGRADHDQRIAWWRRRSQGEFEPQFKLYPY